jgi:hypothetical protein
MLHPTTVEDNSTGSSSRAKTFFVGAVKIVKIVKVIEEAAKMGH